MPPQGCGALTPYSACRYAVTASAPEQKARPVAPLRATRCSRSLSRLNGDEDRTALVALAEQIDDRAARTREVDVGDVEVFSQHGEIAEQSFDARAFGAMKRPARQRRIR